MIFFHRELGGDLEDSKHIVIIHPDQKWRLRLDDLMKANTFQSITGSRLEEIPLEKNSHSPTLFLLSASCSSPEQLRQLKENFSLLSIIILVDPGHSGDGLRLLEQNLVDHIQEVRFLPGILAAVRSEYQRLLLLNTNQSYRKTIRKLKSIKKESSRKNLELEEIYDTTLENLMTALDIRDVETFGHSRTVAKYTQVLAQILGISNESRLENMRRGALLHDIGKIAIPDSILKKPGSLTSSEWRKIRLHPALGFGLIKEIKLVNEVGHIILYHHERFDGQGYPQGLAAENIPLEARIFSLADALDAITSHRPYRERRSFSIAREEIREKSNRQFDPDVVDAFCSVSLDKWEKIRFETTKLLPSFELFMEANK